MWNVCRIFVCLGDGNWYISPTLYSGNITEDGGNVYRYDQSSVDKNLWLFDIANDPYEETDVSDLYPDIVQQLLQRLADYNATAVPCRFPEGDINSNPDLRGGVFLPWL